MVLMNSYFILLVLILYYHFVAQIVTDLTIGNPFTLASVSFCLVPISTFWQHRMSLTTSLASALESPDSSRNPERSLVLLFSFLSCQ